MSDEFQLSSTKKGQIKVESFAGTRTTTWVLSTDMEPQEFLDAIADILAIVSPEDYHRLNQQLYPQDVNHTDPAFWDAAEEVWEDDDPEKPGGGRKVDTMLGIGVDWAKENDKYASIPPPAGDVGV